MDELNPTLTEPDVLPVGQDPRAYLEPADFWTKASSLIGIIVPLVALVVAIILSWGEGFSWLYAALLAGMYVLTAFGITIGYHRLFTHKSFKCPRWVYATFNVLGAMAVEGPVNKWVAMHRCHHQHSDDHADPHSPHHHGSGIKGVLHGFFHAHIGWIFRGDPKDLERYNPDLRADAMMRFFSWSWGLWSILGLIIPAVIAGLITMSWIGAFLGFLWGGLVRVLLVHHVTWSINSVCHLWGRRPYNTKDESRNNWLFGILGMGEGWHNNHHAFPTSARHGLRWYQIDFSYMIIKFLEKIGLAYDVKVPPAHRLAMKSATPA